MAARGPDDGMATVWVAALVVLVVAATVLAVGAASAATARHTAQLAADLAALAGAGRIGVTDDACAAAQQVAAADGADLLRCDVTATAARAGEVRVEVSRRVRWCGLDLDAHARARAARLPSATAARPRPPPAPARPRPPPAPARPRPPPARDRCRVVAHSDAGPRCGGPDRVAA